jgi:hypothetical protein
VACEVKFVEAEPKLEAEKMEEVVVGEEDMVEGVRRVTRCFPPMLSGASPPARPSSFVLDPALRPIVASEARTEAWWSSKVRRKWW